MSPLSPPSLTLSFFLVSSRSLCFQLQSGPASGWALRHVLSRGRQEAGSSAPCKAADYLRFLTGPGFSGHRGAETNKTKVGKQARWANAAENIMSRSYSQQEIQQFQFHTWARWRRGGGGAGGVVNINNKHILLAEWNHYQRSVLVLKVNFIQNSVFFTRQASPEETTSWRRRRSDEVWRWFGLSGSWRTSFKSSSAPGTFWLGSDREEEEVELCLRVFNFRRRRRRRR